ncbi:hypothetical protein TKK_0004709 [Trichogramma kaykai]
MSWTNGVGHRYTCLLGTANSNLVGARGLTPLQIICQRHETDTQKGRSHWMAVGCIKHIIESMLRNNDNPNLVNEEGLTTLHIICANNHGDVFVKLFFKVCQELNHLVQVNAQDKLGNTPLHVALKSIKLEVAELLIKKGADLNIADAEGLTPCTLCRCKSLATCSRCTSESWSCPASFSPLSGVLAVTERLEDKGYELDRHATLTIMKLFRNNKLYDKWLNKYEDRYDNQYWLNDENFKNETKKVMIIPDLPLYELIQLRPKEAEKRLMYTDYLEFARSSKLGKLSEKRRDACIEHLCEKLSRGVFRRWALDSFLKLIHNRLPILYYDMIMDHLENKDF